MILHVKRRCSLSFVRFAPAAPQVVRVDLVRTRSAWLTCVLSATAASSIDSTRLVMALAEEGERCDMFVVKGDDFILPERRVTVI